VPAGKWSYQSDSIVKIDPSAFVEDGNYRIDYSFASTQTRRLFKRIPIDRTQPTKVRISAAEEFDAGASGSWGYSCYTDQGRNIFWSKNFSTGGNISGINMITGQPVPLDEAPNQAVTINLPDNVNFNLRSPTQSYAMAGGGSGFILSASSTYTASYETSSNLVFMSISGQRKLLVGKGECFSGEKINCAASDIKVFDPGIVLGPLSSLNDGRVVGLTRNTTSVYLLKAVDRNDLSKGIEVKNIKTLSGDPYMYTDFTGATAFAEAKEITIDLRSRPGFRADEDLSQPEVRWQSEAPAGDRWRGLTMSIRCYLAGNSPPPYQALNNVSSSGIWSPVAIASCSGVYDRVQIYLDGNGNADFARLNAVEFRARQ
jgi:hypothetical protein